MNHVSPTGPDALPLDFNTPRHANSVADAPVSESRPPGASPAPVFDAESLLAEIGLPAHVARRLLTERSAPTV